jgi:hypothetical protein
VKRRIYNILLVAVPVCISLGIYWLQLMFFHDGRNTMFYFMQDLAFVPINAVIVTLILNNFLNIREKQHAQKKINVTISTFFIEAGNDIIRELLEVTACREDFCRMMDPKGMSTRQIKDLKKQISEWELTLELDRQKLMRLAEILDSKMAFMLLMLESSNLVEHDAFTDMLWAVFHLADELHSRTGFSELPPSDIDHLSLDVRRAYRAILLEWVDYLKYLHSEYPYLYSLALRKNPFSASREVRVLG